MNPTKEVTEHSLHIFDNPDYYDRYTIIFPNGDVYGCSKKPKHAKGFCQFSHNTDGKAKEFTFEGKANYVSERRADPNETEISLNQLPRQVQNFIKPYINHQNQ